MAGINEEMLINLESPEKNSNVTIHNHYLKNPLIPGPDLNCNELESNNPFDIVAQSAENWDPFELVLHQSLVQFGKNDYSTIDKCDKLVDGEFSLVNDNYHRINRSNSVSSNVKFFPSTDKQYEKSEIDALNVSSRSLDNSPSLREKIKRVVKKRVSKCIERALNVSASHVELKPQDISSPKKRQLRFSTANSFTCREAEKVKEDALEGYDLKNFLEEAKQLSFIINNMSAGDESIISPTNQDKQSPIKGKKTLFSEPKVEVEDLMSVKPPWEGIDSESTDSDDNSIGLPKVKLFYMKKKDKERKNELNQDQLAHYKRRIRASIEGNVSCTEETITEEAITITTTEKLEEKQTFGEQQSSGKISAVHNKPKEKEPLEFLAVNKPIVPTATDLRLKKVGSILKKGPLKAIVPLQKMTKSLAQKMSPLKKHSPSYKFKGKSCDDSTLSSSLIYPPVATSTPNSKSSSNIKSSAITPISVKPRPRVSRKDAEPSIVNSRRSVSLSAEARKGSQLKQPFSSINPNDNHKWKRPHTAPSPNTRQALKSSPQLKSSDARKQANKLSAYGKENRLQTY